MIHIILYDKIRPNRRKTAGRMTIKEQKQHKAEQLFSTIIKSPDMKSPNAFDDWDNVKSSVCMCGYMIEDPFFHVQIGYRIRHTKSLNSCKGLRIIRWRQWEPKSEGQKSEKRKQITVDQIVDELPEFEV